MGSAARLGTAAFLTRRPSALVATAPGTTSSAVRFADCVRVKPCVEACARADVTVAPTSLFSLLFRGCQWSWLTWPSSTPLLRMMPADTFARIRTQPNLRGPLDLDWT
jgi:hypothetical protein